MFLSHADYAEFANGTRSARAAVRDIPHSSPDSGGEYSLCLTKNAGRGRVALRID